MPMPPPPQVSGQWAAVIGSRRTPLAALHVLANFGEVLARNGWGLTSGGADGADLAGEHGFRKAESDFIRTGTRFEGGKCIYLPWEGFNNSISPYFEPSPEAVASVDEFHPAPHKLTPKARLLMARNWHQVMGHGQGPVRLILCWTDADINAGGTSQALRIANKHHIHYFNLFEAFKEQELCGDGYLNGWMNEVCSQENLVQNFWPL